MQRSRPTLHLFENRTAKEKKRLEVLVSELSPGPKRDEIRQEIRQLETAAASVDKWVSSRGLKSPR
jgi:hypothetical protein